MEGVLELDPGIRSLRTLMLFMGVDGAPLLTVLDWFDGGGCLLLGGEVPSSLSESESDEELSEDELSEPLSELDEALLAGLTSDAGFLTPEDAAALDVAAVAFDGGDPPLRRALASRDGPILPFITARIDPTAYAHERAVCVDTTAAGGNAELLARAG